MSESVSLFSAVCLSMGLSSDFEFSVIESGCWSGRDGERGG